MLLTERSRGKSWVEVISKIGRFDDVVIVDDVFGGANFCEKIIWCSCLGGALRSGLRKFGGVVVGLVGVSGSDGDICRIIDMDKNFESKAACIGSSI